MHLPLGIVVSLLLVKSIQSQQQAPSYEIEYNWSTLDIVIPNGQNASQYVRDAFDGRNLIVEDAAKTWDNRTFVSTKVYDSLPTLHTLRNGPEQGSPVLIPFPNWEFHVTVKSCRRIMEIKAMLIDAIGRLWVLSRGLGACPDRLLVFSLNRNEFLSDIELPVALNERPRYAEFFYGASVELSTRNPNTVMIYVDDVNRLLILKVHLISENKTVAMRVYHDSLEYINVSPNPEVRFQYGVSAISLSYYRYPPANSSSQHLFRYLYFRVLPQNYVYRIVTTRFDRYDPQNDVPFEILPYAATQQAISRDAVVFYSIYGNNGVGCYIVDNPPPAQFNGFLFPELTGGFYSALKTYELEVNNNQEQRLMAFYKRHPEDPDVNNRYYAIISSRVEDAISGTNCTSKDSRTMKSL